jgi:myo-inositol-1(or 4)-monophosphatase
MRREAHFAADIAREAGALLRGLAAADHVPQAKGSDIDLVTEADRKSEALLLSRIAAEFPDHGVLAEEGSSRPRRSPFRWVLDPLDGTTNYAHRFPHYAVSIALEENGVAVVGVVYDVCLGELFSAERGAGAFLNGQRLAVSKTPDLAHALLATGFPYDRKESAANNLDHFAHIELCAQGVRRAGSAALDLCYVAAGRFDGFWEMKLGRWDVAAGALCVSEAAGRLSDFAGAPWNGEGREVVATNGLLHDELVEALRGGKRP